MATFQKESRGVCDLSAGFPGEGLPRTLLQNQQSRKSSRGSTVRSRAGLTGVGTVSTGTVSTPQQEKGHTPLNPACSPAAREAPCQSATSPPLCCQLPNFTVHELLICPKTVKKLASQMSNQTSQKTFFPIIFIPNSNLNLFPSAIHYQKMPQEDLTRNHGTSCASAGEKLGRPEDLGPERGEQLFLEGYPEARRPTGWSCRRCDSGHNCRPEHSRALLASLPNSWL